ncbi:hypothetical protein [Chitiniphilus eburneus]|uniref:hypothetical protein n=1 Tax=Chitiniphilus eburneus TaxID=2571148 RepID=UPI0035CF153A
MPAPRDLTGQRYGGLLVLGPADPPTGRSVSAWRCLCDCGRMEDIPTSRLPHTPSQAKLRGIRWRCTVCMQTRTCAVCGATFQSVKARSACSNACHTVQQKARQREWYQQKTSSDPSYNQQVWSRRKAHAAADPAAAQRLRQTHQAANLRYRANIAADPERTAQRKAAYAEHYAAHRDEIQARRRQRLEAMSPEARDALRAQRRAYQAAYYQTHREAIQARQRARHDAMTPAQQAHWLERMRAYGRAYRRHWRADLAANPAAHQRYRDLMREYRRLRALRQLMGIGAELIKRSKRA